MIRFAVRSLKKLSQLSIIPSLAVGTLSGATFAFADCSHLVGKYECQQDTQRFDLEISQDFQVQDGTVFTIDKFVPSQPVPLSQISVSLYPSFSTESDLFAECNDQNELVITKHSLTSIDAQSVSSYSIESGSNVLKVIKHRPSGKTQLSNCTPILSDWTLASAEAQPYLAQIEDKKFDPSSFDPLFLDDDSLSFDANLKFDTANKSSETPVVESNHPVLAQGNSDNQITSDESDLPVLLRRIDQEFSDLPFEVHPVSMLHERCEQTEFAQDLPFDCRMFNGEMYLLEPVVENLLSNLEPTLTEDSPAIEVPIEEPLTSPKCPYCNRKYDNMGILTRHLRTTHHSLLLPLEEVRNRMKALKYYPQATQSHYLYLLDRMKKSAENNFRCPHCEYQHHNLAILKNHFVKHLEFRPFSCSYCDRRFKNKDVLNKHRCYLTSSEKLELKRPKGP